MSEYYDDETLSKVYDALLWSGLTGKQAEDAVNEMQNAGILFRERAPEPTIPEAPGPSFTPEFVDRTVAEAARLVSMEEEE